VPAVRCVVGALDAQPGPRRAAAEAAVGAAAAERFRRAVASAQRRRDYLALARHPHGVLGVDGPDNEASAVYGDVAARAAAAQEAQWARDAAREARLLRADAGPARRGYDALAPGAEPARGGAGGRVGADEARAGVDARLAARDGGGGFLARRARGGAAPGVDTRRTVGGGEGEAPRGARAARVAAITGGETQGRRVDVITGAPLSAWRAPTIDERVPSARSQHPAIVGAENPLGR